MRFYLVLLLTLIAGTNQSQAQSETEAQAVPAELTPLPYLRLEDVPEEPLSEELEVKEEKSRPKYWSGESELGLTGTEGNSQNFKIRLGGKVKRETDRTIFTLDAIYRLANLQSVRSENRLFATDKMEFLFHKRPMSFFLSGTTEYDQFKAFDVRLARHTGFEYFFLKNDTTTLKARLGFGASKEIGGPQNKWVPEALVGSDFEWTISKRQKLTATVDVFPDVSDPTDYRAQAKIAWELLIDPEMGLTLRLGILDLFDSTPESNRKRNDIDYFATLLWKF